MTDAAKTALRAAACLLALVIVCVLAPRSRPRAMAQRYSEARVSGTIRDARVQEISGIAPAHGKPGYFWVHNDSGGKSRLFLVHLRGRVVSELEVTGAEARDWEDIAVGPGRRPGGRDLYIADTGNNGLDRKVLKIYRIRHPDLAPDPLPARIVSEPAERISFRYPDGTFDCEALVVHPRTGDLYLLTKQMLVSAVYRLRSPRTDGTIETAVRVAVMRPGFLVTAADLSPTGDRLLVRTYVSVLEYRLPPQTAFEKIFRQVKMKLPAAAETQSEAICYLHGGLGYVTTQEGSPASLHVVVDTTAVGPAAAGE